MLLMQQSTFVNQLHSESKTLKYKTPPVPAEINHSASLENVFIH